MGLSNILIILLWCLLSSLYIIEVSPWCVALKFGQKLIIILICLIGAPILTAANLLETILNCILPDDWHDDEGGFFL